MSDELRAPFPYFGGKRRVAPEVWTALGADVPNYIEPFCGSAAVLLARPGGPGKIETINDADRMVANFWRAIIADPYAVAAWCDSPVNEADMHARHRWLVSHLQDGAEFRERMHQDPDFFDAKVAGLWVWGICAWIGGGWCIEPISRKLPHIGPKSGRGVHPIAPDPVSPRPRGADRTGEANRPELAGVGKGVHSSEHQKRPVLDGTALGRGVHSELTLDATRPHMSGSHAGMGVHAEGPSQQLPYLSVGRTDHFGGRGVINHQDRQIAAYSPGRRPQISSAGQGVHLPSLGNDRGINGVSLQGTFQHALRELLVPDAPPCFEWFARLALRLRRVRVACGDFERVLGPSVLGKGKNVGGRRPCAVFLDPSYDPGMRSPYLYGEDSKGIAARAREWALNHGDDPDLRIALCGYDGEHEMPSTWTEYAWKAARGYASEDNENRAKERIWFSPHCLPLDGAKAAQGVLFG